MMINTGRNFSNDFNRQRLHEIVGGDELLQAQSVIGPDVIIILIIHHLSHQRPLC
jgi:hypothetical protein